MVSAETSGAAGPLILLCGPSGVGKSSVAKELAAARHLALLSQDSYFGGDFVPYAEALERGRAEMEEPDHIDWDRVRLRLILILSLSLTLSRSRTTSTGWRCEGRLARPARTGAPACSRATPCCP